MSIIEPKIDVLLDRTDNDRFLLCALASKRAHDINDMMRGQRDRAIQLQPTMRQLDRFPRWDVTRPVRRMTADGPGNTHTACDGPRSRRASRS